MRIFLALLLLAVPLSAPAQSPYLVKDLNTSGSSSPGSSTPEGFCRFGSGVYFAATTAEVGRKLWSTDGTREGTTVVVSSVPDEPSRLVVLNGKLLFNGRDIAHGQELWVTDGTQSGTRVLADIAPGRTSSEPGDRIVYHGKLLFAANDGQSGMELWSTDGTAGGTAILKDLQPGTLNPNSFVVLNDTVYFGASNGLWKSNGTAAGTQLVAPGNGVYNVAVAGAHVFFSTADDAVWVSDGTAAGTRQIAALTGYHSGKLASFGDKVLFVVARQPWISDGTVAGTHRIRDMEVGMSSIVPEFVAFGPFAYFSGQTSLNKFDLWKTDGTEGGTTLVKNVARGSGTGSPTAMMVVGDKLYFAASQSGGPSTLWVTDGTGGGTRQVTAGGAPVAVFDSAAPFAAIDGVLYFDGANTLNGFEPWRSDGTDAGTFMLGNLQADPSPSSFPHNFVVAGDYLYFDAWDGAGPVPSSGSQHSLWRSDGTAAGTLKLADVDGATDLVAAGRMLYFQWNNALWVSDGTPDGIRPFIPGLFPLRPTAVAVAGHTIFATVPGYFDFDLWAAPVDMSTPAVPLNVFGGYGFTDVGGSTTMFFTEESFDNVTLWITDGTTEGTALVAEHLDRVDGKKVVSVGGALLWFSAAQLWKSDGTPEGTAAVMKLPFDADAVGNLAVAGRNVFFTSGDQLWVSDGTETGTRMLAAIGGVRRLAVLGDRVFFRGNDPTNGGRAVYVSDGTPEGTRLLRDVADPHVFGPDDIASDGTAVYFTGTDPLYGSEVWTSDGTADGTKLLADLEPGKASSDGQYFVRAGEHVFFAATTAATGTELWALPAAPSRLRVDDIRVAEGDSGTTAARFTVTLSSPAGHAVSVDYATSDGSARAGRDYEAAAGTLTFASGETAKSVDVLVHGNTDPQNNRAFFFTLRNAAGAGIERPVAVGVIDDDDKFADVGLALDFSHFDRLRVLANATNAGPRTATNVKATYTATPANSGNEACLLCTTAPIQLAPGATANVIDYSWPPLSQYITATVAGRERDRHPSNNSVAWMTNGFMAMDALYLTPGGQANVYYGAGQSLTVLSTAPSVVSVPPAAQNAAGSNVVTFVARGVSAGTATIVVRLGTQEAGRLTVNVVEPGTKMRWPGGVSLSIDRQQVAFDKPATVYIESAGAVPYSGEHATGVVTLSVNRKEVARQTLDGTMRKWAVPLYMTGVGSNGVEVSYSGDANFLPVATEYLLDATRGAATIAADAPQRNGTSVKVHVTVTGSPAAAPIGTISVSEIGGFGAEQAALAPAPVPGVSQADVTLTNVAAGAQTLLLTYSGDARYNSSTQNVRLADPRPRAVRH